MALVNCDNWHILDVKGKGEFGDLSDILLSSNSNSKLYQNDQIATERHSYSIH